MEEAPKEKPVKTERVIFKASPPSNAPNSCAKYANNPPNPRMPNPTTPSPMTEPPAKATSRALPKLSRAAFVVLTFALVATTIPK